MSASLEEPTHKHAKAMITFLWLCVHSTNPPPTLL